MSDILFDVENGVGFITLNRPQARNSLTTPMVKAIAAHLDEWEADSDVRMALIRGAGEHGLCAGGDVKGMYAGAVARDDSRAAFATSRSAFVAVSTAMRASASALASSSGRSPRSRPDRCSALASA